MTILAENISKRIMLYVSHLAAKNSSEIGKIISANRKVLLGYEYREQNYRRRLWKLRVWTGIEAHIQGEIHL